MQCVNCKVKSKELQTGPDNKKYCDDCFNELFISCYACDEIINADDSFVNANGEVFCQSCYEERYAPCNRCDNEVETEDAYTDESGNYYHADCYYEIYAVCETCGCELYREDAYVDDDGYYYCESCYGDTDRAIYRSSYKPSPVMHKLNYENTTYLGFELEVETDDPQYVAEELGSQYDKDIFYIKEDGSLENGIEIVTHPHTLQKHRARHWRKLLQYLRGQSCTSYDNKRCGLHVHVNRNALSDKDWHKVEWFFWKCKTRIIGFSKRTKEQIESWANFNKPAEIKDIKANMRPGTMHRYSALNFTNSKTVEFRIFRGTLEPRRFWASLCFVAALVDFIQEIGISYIVTATGFEIWRDFVNWTKRDYKFLYDYLRRH